MKKKTINAVICKKFDDFISSIKDDKVKSLVEKNTLITGGCIASMLLKEPVNDYDLYFTNKETVKAVAEYYVKQFNAANDEDGYVLDGAGQKPNEGGGVAMNMTEDRIKIIFSSKGVAREGGDIEDEEILEQFPDAEVKVDNEPKYRPVYLSCNAITLSNQIQIVIRFYGEATQVHDNYDFVHCTNYWTSKDRKVVLNQEALESLLAKELKYIGSKYPVASVVRTRKFINRQWTINAGQYLKMCFQISKLDLSNVAVLEDQLVGVDVAYFNMLINALKDHSDKEDGKKVDIDYSYLAEIIDRIF